MSSFCALLLKISALLVHLWLLSGGTQPHWLSAAQLPFLPSSQPAILLRQDASDGHLLEFGPSQLVFRFSRDVLRMTLVGPVRCCRNFLTSQTPP